jgi:hypothetical protein
MRKSTLFVSAMLTVFLMATMFGVVSAYQQVVKNNDMTSTQQTQKALAQPIKVEFAPVPTEAVLPAPTVVTAEEATTIAVEFLGDPNVFSVEVVDYQGAPAYLVTFSSGDLVYVSSTGVVIANEKLQPVYVAANSSNNKKNNGGGSSDNGSNSSGGGGGESHEEHDDHEEHEDHDD